MKKHPAAEALRVTSWQVAKHLGVCFERPRGYQNQYIIVLSRDADCQLKLTPSSRHQTDTTEVADFLVSLSLQRKVEQTIFW